MPSPVVPPIKAHAILLRITARQFADATGLDYLHTTRVWSGRIRPSPNFIRLATSYFRMSATDLFGEAATRRTDKSSPRRTTATRRSA